MFLVILLGKITLNFEVDFDHVLFAYIGKLLKAFPEPAQLIMHFASAAASNIDDFVKQ